MRVLVVNAGSSSLKLAVLDGEHAEARASADRAPGQPMAELFGRLLGEVGVEWGGSAGVAVDAVAHRVVHGGERFVAPTLLDDAAVAAIEALAELAPLHNGPAVEAIRAARLAIPAVPHVAAFDTAFHAGLPETARRDPVPDPWVRDWGLRRYGFHGLSVEWAVGRAAELLDRPAGGLEVVVAHLGGGSSVTAVSGGRSEWTSMGFTPLDGLMMQTRPGSLDPGLVLHVLRRGLLDLDGIEQALERESGLAGVSRRSGDVRKLERAASAGDERARLALDLFVDRAAAGIAAASTRLSRLDAVAFTGGIGEHAGRVRAAIVARLGVLGLAPVEAAETGEDRILAPGSGSSDHGRPAALRIEAREDIVMARAAASLLESGVPDFVLVQPTPVVAIIAAHVPELLKHSRYQRLDPELRSLDGLVMAAVAGMCDDLGRAPDSVVDLVDILANRGEATVDELIRVEFFENLDPAVLARTRIRLKGRARTLLDDWESRGV